MIHGQTAGFVSWNSYPAVACRKFSRAIGSVSSPKVRWEGHQIGGRQPIGSMYGIYTNIGGILMANVTIYGIHGSYGQWPWRRLGVSHAPWDTTWRFRREERRCEQLMAEKGALSVWSTGLDLGSKGPEGPKGKSNRRVRRGFATVLALWIFVWLNHVVSCCFMLFLYSVPDL